MVKNPMDFNQLTINHPSTSYIPEWVATGSLKRDSTHLQWRDIADLVEVCTTEEDAPF